MVERSRTLAMGELERVTDRPFVQQPYSNALLAAAERNPNIVGLTADLGKYTDMLPFAAAYPERYFNVGMAEQNLIMISAGLAKAGKVAFCTTYAVFATRRAYDFIAIACAHSNANVKIMAGMAGLTNGYGATHQAVDDFAMTTAIPDLTVIDPCDATEMAQVVEDIAERPGTFYVRLQRGNVPVVLDPERYRFEVGKAQILREGSDVGIISTGPMTIRALDAAAELAAEGVSVGVLHVPTLKPFDEETVAAFASSCARIVTAEAHRLTGGLGSRVMEALFTRGISKPIRRVGLPDRFFECGSAGYLEAKFGIDKAAVLQAARPR